MDSHNGADTAKEEISLEAVVKVHGNKTRLPVVTMYDIGTEADNGKSAESRL